MKMGGFPDLSDLSHELKKIMSCPAPLDTNPQLNVVSTTSPECVDNVEHANFQAVDNQRICDGFEELREKKGSSSTPFESKTQPVSQESCHDSGLSLNCKLDLSKSLINADSTDSDQLKKSELVPTLHSQPEFTLSKQDSGFSESSQHVELSSSSQSGLLRLHEYCMQLNKRCPIGLRIGRNMGVECLDILHELNVKGICCLSQIFGYLSDKDLQSCLKVCSNWSTMLHADKRVKNRLNAITKARQVLDKENTSPTKGKPLSPNLTTAKAPLGFVQMRCVSSQNNSRRSLSKSPPRKSTTNFERYTQEAAKLKVGEKLVKCIRCSAPAKFYSEGRAQCTMVGCQFNFCTNCTLEYHGARDCITRSPKKTKTDVPIDSRTSKKALKRNL